MEMHNPAHPGEVLKELFIPTGLTVAEAARRLGVSRQALSAILIAGPASVPRWHCVCQKRLAPVPMSGWGCRCNMTSGRRSANRPKVWKSWRPERLCRSIVYRQTIPTKNAAELERNPRSRAGLFQGMGDESSEDAEAKSFWDG